jgi:hypothetical protein
MESALSSTEQPPFRFLDFSKEIRLMVYERLMHRRHHKLVYNCGSLPGSTITLVFTEPLSPIHRTCRMLHAEAALFLTSRFVPRLLLTDNEYSHKPYDLIVDLLGSIQEAYHGPHSIAKELQRYRPYYPLSAVPPEATGRFQTEDYKVIARWVNRAARYLEAARPTNDQPHNSLQMALRVADKDDVYWGELQAKLRVLCSYYMVRTTIYDEDDAPSERKLNSRVEWVIYGGVIDRMTWEKDWMANC